MTRVAIYIKFISERYDTYKEMKIKLRLIDTISLYNYTDILAYIHLSKALAITKSI